MRFLTQTTRTARKSARCCVWACHLINYSKHIFAHNVDPHPPHGMCQMIYGSLCPALRSISIEFQLVAKWAVLSVFIEMIELKSVPRKAAGTLLTHLHDNMSVLRCDKLLKKFKFFRWKARKIWRTTEMGLKTKKLSEKLKSNTTWSSWFELVQPKSF